jgi:nucleotide-binding universal stress UspA family protein
MSGRLVVGIDGSPSSRRALRWAIDEARHRRDEVDAVLVWQHQPTFWPISGLPTRDELAVAARRVLDTTIAGEDGDAVGGGTRINPVLVEGPAARSLVDAARGASLLVVGSHGWGVFTGMVLGSVSQHCVAHAPCTVVVVPNATVER